MGLESYGFSVPAIAKRRPAMVDTVGRLRIPRRSDFYIQELAYEGGYQPQKTYENARRLYNGRRETPRAMYPGELLALLRQFKHPRYSSVGIVATRFGDQPRSDFGLEEHGTLFACTQWHRDWLDAVPKNCLPWSNIRTAVWDDRAMCWRGGLLVRGWRSLLESLVARRVLRPDPHLSFLTGVDTHVLAQKRSA